MPNALDNEDGAARDLPHIPDDMPPVDYEGDYQLEKAIEFLNSGGIVASTESRSG